MGAGVLGERPRRKTKTKRRRRRRRRRKRRIAQVEETGKG